MGERGIDRVQIARSRQTIPWESREALLERRQGVESMRDVVGTSGRVGTSRPVELTPEQKDGLVGAIAGTCRGLGSLVEIA